MANLRKVRLYLKLTHEQILRYYGGTAKHVVALDVRGKTVQFPVKILQPFVTHDGVQGFFDIYFDDQGKFVTVKRNDSS